jgi:hypothetical protein
MCVLGAGGSIGSAAHAARPASAGDSGRPPGVCPPRACMARPGTCPPPTSVSRARLLPAWGAVSRVGCCFPCQVPRASTACPAHAGPSSPACVRPGRRLPSARGCDSPDVCRPSACAVPPPRPPPPPLLSARLPSARVSRPRASVVRRRQLSAGVCCLSGVCARGLHRCAGGHDVIRGRRYSCLLLIVRATMNCGGMATTLAPWCCRISMSSLIQRVRGAAPVAPTRGSACRERWLRWDLVSDDATLSAPVVRSPPGLP